MSLNRLVSGFSNLNLTMLLALLLLLGSQPLSAANGFHVVTSIKPIHSILASLMQGTEGPELLVAGDRTPYGYQLTEQQKRDVANASLLVWVGPELEKFLIKPAAAAAKSGTQVMTLLDNLELKILPSRWAKGENDNERDPFFWLDTRNAIILVDELARTLANADPNRAHIYLRNRKNLLGRVAEIDRRLEYGYRGLKSGIGMSYYDTLQYFEQAYALKVRGVLAKSPEQSVSAVKLLKSHAKLEEGYYSCLLTERDMPMPDLDLLTKGIKINIGVLDSFGTALKAGPELYFQLMQHTTDAIKQCLQYNDKPVDETAEADVNAGVDADLPSPGRIRGRFMLINQDGQLVTDEDMKGKFQLIYFGYTFCPDVCPTALQVISQALDMMGDKAKLVQPYFITVDPERDNAAVMKKYVQYFNKRLIGLTGSKAMIARVAEEFKVKYQKVIEKGADPKLYTMDHSASVFLMAPDGEFITKFAHGISAKQLEKGIEAYLPR